MQSHLRVVINDIDVVLPDNADIEIHLKNRYFNADVETYSYSFDIPFDGNRALFGDVDSVQSDVRLTSIEGLPMKIYVDGILLCHGKVGPVSDQVIDGKVSVSLTSKNPQIVDMIGDLNIQNLEFPESDRDALTIGETIGDIRAKDDSQSRFSARARFSGQFHGASSLHGVISFDISEGVSTSIDNNFTNLIQLQALGFSMPRRYRTAADGLMPVTNDRNIALWDRNYINTHAAYNENITMRDTEGNGDNSVRRALYHNARISYTHHDIDADGKSTDTVVIDNDAYGPYYVLEADRPQSGICIYLMYVLEVLFGSYLKLDYDPNYIGQCVDDFRRLSFFTTKCKYDLVRRDGRPDDNPHFPYSKNLADMNKWLSARMTHGRLEAGKENRSKEIESGESYSMLFYDNIYACQYRLSADEYDDLNGTLAINDENVKPFYLFGKKSERKRRPVQQGSEFDFNIVFYDSEYGYADELTRLTCRKIEISDVSDSYEYCGFVMDMIANAYNLPDMSAKSLLDSLWASFGLRFYYDTESNHVEPYFIRDILRSTEAPVPVFGQIISEHKYSEKITGVNMRYSAEKDRIEQLGDVRKGVTDYDTRYDYLVEKTPERNIVFDGSMPYAVFHRGTLSAGDKSLYVDSKTGNCYRVKISKEKLSAGEIQSLQPSMFQVAQSKGITVYADKYKDLTEEELTKDEVKSYVEELVSEFEPLEQNDLNGNKPKDEAFLAPFIDEEMWNEHAGMDNIRNVVDSNAYFIFYIDEALETEERYDVSGSDDGNSPLQSHDWGPVITLMRGGGGDASVSHFNRGYDFFDNEMYRINSGVYMLDSDSISIYGHGYDYNTGSVEGDGDGERISLKIRAYKTDASGRELIGGDATPDVKYRGLADQFMAEYIYFLLNRKKVQITMLCEIAHLINIDWKRRYQIGDNTGWLDEVTVKASVDKGIESVELTMFKL